MFNRPDQYQKFEIIIYYHKRVFFRIFVTDAVEIATITGWICIVALTGLQVTINKFIGSSLSALLLI